METNVHKLRQWQEFAEFLAAMGEKFARALKMQAAGCTHAEIAEELDLPSEDAARKTLERARKKLDKLRKR